MDGKAKIRVWFLLAVAFAAIGIYVSLPKTSLSEELKIEEQIVQSLILPESRLKPLKLPSPVFVVGFPKSGTTSIWQFFNCSGIVSQHFCCCGDESDHPPCETNTMAKCILRNMAKERPMLEDCGDYQVYAQLDGERPIHADGLGMKGVLLNNGSLHIQPKALRGNSLLMRHFLPQHFHLDEIHQHAPSATYVLPLRDPIVWANSAFKWFAMRGRFVNEYIAHNSSIERPGKARAVDFLARIYQDHTEFVRDFVQKHPTHALVEVNITASDAGKVMATAFGLNEECWGHHNKRGNHTRLATKNNSSASID
jgi:predicted SnoaL-like aldol condensation-catalyzing enzyme